MSPRLVPVEPSDDSKSTFANDAMTLLWQNAQDRETGAEAVVAIRAARRQPQDEPDTEAPRSSRLRRFLLGR
jgi:hypothetical protein